MSRTIISPSANKARARGKGQGSGNGGSILALHYPIIACGNLRVFLHLLPMRPTNVLLMPISRREGVMGSLNTTTAVQVTACTEQERHGNQAILTATFLAAACTTIGGKGSLLAPCEERAKPATYLWQRVHDVQAELLHCLVLALQEHPSVACVYHPARYCIPDEWMWSHYASLDGSGIRFQMNHWTWLDAVPQTGDANADEPSL